MKWFESDCGYGHGYGNGYGHGYICGSGFGSSERHGHGDGSNRGYGNTYDFGRGGGFGAVFRCRKHDGLVMIGCKTMAPDEWLKVGPTLEEFEEVPPEQVECIRIWIEGML